MQKLFAGLSRKSGLVPGTMVHVAGERHDAPVHMTVFSYDADHVEERKVASAEEVAAYRGKRAVTWVNVDGVHRTEVIEQLGRVFELHHLLLEDVAHTDQRPKLEDFESCTYLVLRMLYERSVDAQDDHEFAITSEQVSMIVGPDFVLTFEEDPGDVFEPVRRRLREGKGRVRKLGADYLAYVLIDVIVDNYFAVLERFGDEVDELESELLDDPRADHLQEIRSMKRAMVEMRRAVWPLRDALATLLRGDVKLFKKATLIYVRDAYDHAMRVADAVEVVREMVEGMLEVYMSNVSNRMNQVMKVLTVIATVFIPLTFIVGVYGMNFDNMPELHWRYGYWIVWGVMAVVGVALLSYFWRKKWF
ncbi:MAG: magnesium/cobalt transporter CorA [Gemmatimonadota bacterium]|nr:MAG: magnesium/cobalt transporter CorA [Gemmatimonadota bacterium]